MPRPGYVNRLTVGVGERGEVRYYEESPAPIPMSMCPRCGDRFDTDFKDTMCWDQLLEASLG